MVEISDAHIDTDLKTKFAVTMKIKNKDFGIILERWLHIRIIND